MKHYDVVLFDLDGTLTDPGVGITNSVVYSLKKYGIEVSDRKELSCFIGPPLTDSYKKYYGFSDEQAAEAVGYYREYFAPTGIFENTVYEGIGDLLARLKNAGKTLVVATSKPEAFAERILEHFGLSSYFTCIAGATMDSTRVNKEDVIAYALKRCGISDASGAVMIGDREYDIFGAKKCGLDSVGVLFGYGSREELESAGADYIAETPGDIGRILL